MDSDTRAAKEKSYLELFERYIHAMSEPEGFDLGEIYAALTDLCIYLRVCKGVTTIYETAEDEERRSGEDFVCYDSGEPCHPVSEMRTVTPALMIIKCTVYQADGADPLTEEERSRVKMVQRVILTFMNRNRMEQVIDRMTFWDSDGFRNVRYYLHRIVELGRSNRLAGKVAMRFNLKHFALINQQIGREGGDVVMKRYCDQLEDVLGESGVLARLGGDNFVLLSEKYQEARLLEILRGTPVIYDDEGRQRVVISSVVGVYEIPRNFHFKSPGDVMDMITSAYHSAKRGRDGDIVFFSDEIRLEKERIIQVQRDFDAAIKNEEFLVYYQPKVDIETRELIGAEALSRWKKDGKIIPPMEFIPVLERGTDICRLDFYVLDHVCKDVRRWLQEGRRVVRVSVNLSRRHMMDPDLFDHILEIVDRNKVPHEYIEIELTETTTDVEFRDLKRVVYGLREVGIKTSVDDFGIGYSSLNLLKEIPWDVLKLDKSLLPVDRVDEIQRGGHMFAHVISMAHEMGLKCVAEGVETLEQMEILEECGCRIAQGFYFDKPLPVPEFEKRMVRHKYE